MLVILHYTILCKIYVIELIIYIVQKHITYIWIYIYHIFGCTMIMSIITVKYKEWY